MKKLNIFLCGYHFVGCSILRQILMRDDIARVAVFTHEPGPTTPDLRAFCAERDVWCSTESINTARGPFVPDLVASIYYRTIIKSHIIDQVGGRIFNLHPSLLPRHRGCSSLTWALLQGDQVTGITYHYVVPAVDEGNVIVQAALQIGPTDTQETLYRRAMELGSAYWPAAFELVKAGHKGIPQHGESTYHRRGPPYGGQINADWSMKQVERFIRAMTHPPYPYATYRGHQVKTIADYIELRERENRPPLSPAP